MISLVQIRILCFFIQEKAKDSSAFFIHTGATSVLTGWMDRLLIEWVGWGRER